MIRLRREATGLYVCHAAGSQWRMQRRPTAKASEPIWYLYRDGICMSTTLPTLSAARDVIAGATAHSFASESLSYGIRCTGCGEWETECRCDSAVSQNEEEQER